MIEMLHRSAVEPTKEMLDGPFYLLLAKISYLEDDNGLLLHEFWLL